MKEILFDVQSFADSYKTSSEVDILKKEKTRYTHKSGAPLKFSILKYFEQF